MLYTATYFRIGDDHMLRSMDVNAIGIWTISRRLNSQIVNVEATAYKKLHMRLRAIDKMDVVESGVIAVHELHCLYIKIK